MKLENVAVLGVGQVRFGVHRAKSALELARDAGLLALADAGLDLRGVGEAFVGYIQPAPMVGI
jgi:hypothetical protein